MNYDYEDLPEEIKNIVPKNKFSTAHKCQNEVILLFVVFDNQCMRWRKVDGRYQFVNRG